MFSGFKNIKPVNYCEVEIGFANKIETEIPETIIKRYMSRGGNNTYFINEKEVQRKYMINALRPFGLGATLFLIIDQGTVDKILDLDPNQLCQIFLESLGYGNYKAEKVDLESKILEKEEQIERFQAELRKNKSRLEVLYNDLKIYDIYSEISNKIDIISKEIAIRQFNNLANEGLTIEKELFDTEKELKKITEHKKACENKYIELKDKIKTLEDDITTKTIVLEKVNSEMHEHEISLERLEGQFALYESKLSTNKNALTSKMGEIELANLENQNNIRKLDNLKNSLPTSLREKDPKELLSLLNYYEKNIVENEKSNLLLKELESKEKSLSYFNSELNLNRTSLTEISFKLSENQKELKNMEEIFNNNILKIQNISKTFEKDQILNEKRKNENKELLSYLITKVDGILGYIEDLYDTEERYKTAVSVSLGNYQRSLVLQNKKNLNNLKYFLKKINKTINVFVLDLLPNFKHQVLTEDILQKHNSRYLINLITFDKELSTLFNNLISNTLLLNSFDDAIKLRSNESFWKYRLVTLEGEIFSSNGQIQIGDKTTKNSISTSEYNELKTITERLNYKIQEQKEITHNLILEQNSLNAQIRIILRERERIESEIISIKSKLSKTKTYSDETSYQSGEVFDNLRENVQLIFEINSINESILNNESKVIKLNKDLKALESEVKEINDKIDEIKRELSVKKENIQSSLNRKNILEVEIKKLKEDLLMHKETSLLLDANKLAEKESEVLKKSYEINNKKTLLERKLSDLISNNDFLNNFVDTKVEIEINKAYRDYSIQELQSSFNNLLKQKNDLGPINFKAKESYNQLKDEIIEQESKIKSIQEILKESNLALKSLDYHVNSEVINSAQKINEKLGLYFNEIFNGSASLIPTKSPITNGITLEVKLPGRKFLNLGMLSGGERAMISILLYVALMENNQTPFCYFDEVDASLDEANLERFINLLHILKRSKQLIVVTHQRLTMEAADNLIGISKNQEGEINCITTKK